MRLVGVVGPQRPTPPRLELDDHAGPEGLAAGGASFGESAGIADAAPVHETRPGTWRWSV